MHWFKLYNKTMDQFRNDVKNEMEDNNMTDEELSEIKNTLITFKSSYKENVLINSFANVSPRLAFSFKSSGELGQAANLQQEPHFPHETFSRSSKIFFFSSLIRFSAFSSKIFNSSLRISIYLAFTFSTLLKILHIGK